MKLLVALVLLTIFSTASAGLCSSSGLKKGVSEFEQCADQSDACIFEWKQYGSFDVRSGYAICRSYGLTCGAFWVTNNCNSVLDGSAEVGGCNDYWHKHRGIVKCIPGKPPQFFQYDAPVMADDEVYPPPFHGGNSNVATSCLNNIPMGKWTTIADGVQATTYRRNVAGKRHVQLRFPITNGKVSDTRWEAYTMHFVFPNPRYNKIMITKDGRFGSLWWDEFECVMHLDWFKLCDPSYRESYTYVDKGWFKAGDRMHLAHADLDRDTNTIYTSVTKRNSDRKVTGAKIYKLDIKLKLIKKRSYSLKHEEGGLDFYRDSNYPHLIKYHEGKLYVEWIRQMLDTHQAAHSDVYDAETLEQDGEPHFMLESCSHCFDNSPMFVSSEGYITYSNMADNSNRGVQLQRIWKRDGEWEAQRRSIYTSAAYKNEIENQVYTAIGSLVETPEGFLSAFSGQATELDTSKTGKNHLPISYNIATVLASRGIFARSDYDVWAQDDVILSTQWSDYTFEKKNGVSNRGKSKEQRVTGTNWITDFEDAYEERNAVNVRILTTGREYFLIWEQWIRIKEEDSKYRGRGSDQSYMETMIMRIDSSGRSMGEPIEVGTNFRIAARDEFGVLDGVYFTFEDAKNDEDVEDHLNQKIINFLLPSDKPECPLLECECDGDHPYSVYIDGDNGCETCECRSRPLDSYPIEDLCTKYDALIDDDIYEWIRDDCEISPTVCGIIFRPGEDDDEMTDGNAVCETFGFKCIGAWEQDDDCETGKSIGCDNGDFRRAKIIAHCEATEESLTGSIKKVTPREVKKQDWQKGIRAPEEDDPPAPVNPEPVQPVAPVHPCDSGNNGGCAHICNKNGNDVFCSCNPGYRPKSNNPKKCKEIGTPPKTHPCDSGNNGGCAHKCNKYGSNAVCTCNPGYEPKTNDPNQCQEIENNHNGNEDGSLCESGQKPWNVGYGVCSTYANSNRAYCAVDRDSRSKLYAYEVCEECGQCTLMPLCVEMGKSWDVGYGDCSSYANVNSNFCEIDKDYRQLLFAYQVCPECGVCETNEAATGTDENPVVEMRMTWNMGREMFEANLPAIENGVAAVVGVPPSAISVENIREFDSDRRRLRNRIIADFDITTNGEAEENHVIQAIQANDFDEDVVKTLKKQNPQTSAFSDVEISSELISMVGKPPQDNLQVDDSTGVSAGMVVGLFLAVMCLAAIGVYVYFKNKPKEAEKAPLLDSGTPVP